MPGLPASPPDPGLTELAAALRDTALAGNHRRLLLLCGTPDWCRAATLVATSPGGRLWIGDHGADDEASVPAHKARTLLGSEQATVIYDAHAGLDVDALAAITGTLRGGGLLLLLTPPLDAWPRHPDPALARLLSSPATPADASGRFITRLVTLLRMDPVVTICAQGQPLPRPAVPDQVTASLHHAGSDGCVSDDQRRALHAILGVVDGAPVVLTADRGRGKSAALGLAAAQLLSAGARRIVVTAPRRAAAWALFHHAAERLGLSREYGNLKTVAGGEIRFIAPDSLLREPPEADLVLVDEAAAIPAPLLEGLLRHYRSIAFATTVHGYEGSGRGFALRFRATLDRMAPGWQDVRLNDPVRWATGDPLEALLFRALLLDAEPASARRDASVEDVRFEYLDRDRLAGDETLLRSLFGLLVQAHYRTTPSNLRQLLDAPGIALHVARIEGTVAAVAVTVDEGRIDPETAFAIWAGHRRLRGHLVAQSLASHAGLMEAPALGYRRVQRIAVEPHLRRRGLGRRLLEQVASTARADGFDLVATSFGFTPELVAFWQASHFTPARVGLRREAASGSHALMMLQPVSARGEALAGTAVARLSRQLPTLLAGPLGDLEPPYSEALRSLAELEDTADAPDPADWQEAAAFAFAHRGPDAAVDALRRVTTVLLQATGNGELPGDVSNALAARFLEGRDWGRVAGLLGVDGRAAATERLRQALQPLLRARSDSSLADLIDRLMLLD